MSFIAKLEKKFGKYAIKNLPLVLIICYAIGYTIEFICEKSGSQFMMYLTLNPYMIIHGQVWRIFSWILIPPPEDHILLAIIMMYFYYSIGTILEKTWGTFQFNLYFFGGMLFTVLGSFAFMGYCFIRYKYGLGTASSLIPPEMLVSYLSVYFSTIYINMSIFLAFSSTFPENVILFMFIIPIKVKYLGFFYGVYLIYDMVDKMVSNPVGFVVPFVVISSLLNFIIFFFTSRKYIMKGRKKTQSQREYVNKSKQAEHVMTKITKHKCAICGRTEKDGDDLVFRFCSKCDGNYEYCQDHLYTHIHFMKNKFVDNE